MPDMTGIILSIDIGTSSLKAGLIDFNGRLRAFVRAPYSGDSDGNSSAYSVQAWERAFALSLENLHVQAPACGIDAVCISGNGPTLVPLRGDGEALPPLYWYDGRVYFPESIERKSFFLPHAAWLKKNSPQEYKTISQFISSHEWLAFRLGAQALTVVPQTAYEPYYWDDEQCRLFDLDREKFPPFVKMGSSMGSVSAKAAADFGIYCGNQLKSGTPIIAGGPDFITALIGTGTIRPGDVCDRTGISEGINVCLAEQSLEGSKALKAEGLRLLPHAIDGLWNISALIPTSVKLFEQYRLDTGQENRPYEELIEELLACNSSLPIPNSSLVLGRTLLHKMALAVRSAVEKLKSAGIPIEQMRVSGGQGKNKRWNQFKADITGIRLMIPEINDGELAGNAVIAACALGAACLKETVDRMIRFREAFAPKSETAL